MSRLEDQLSSLLADAPPDLPAFDFDRVVTRVRRRRARLAVSGVVATVVVAASVVLPLALTHASAPVTRPTLVSPSVPATATPEILAEVGDDFGIYDAATGKLSHPVKISAVQAIATNPAGGWVVISSSAEGKTFCPAEASKIQTVDAAGKIRSLDVAVPKNPTDVAVAPDGSKIAIAYSSPCGVAPAGIDVESFGAQQLRSEWVLPLTVGNEIDGLSWSADSRRLAFTPGMQTGAGISGPASVLDTQAAAGKLTPGKLPYALADGCEVDRTAWLGATGNQVVVAECLKTRDSEVVDVAPGTLQPVSKPIHIASFGNDGGQFSVSPDAKTIVLARGDGVWEIAGARARAVVTSLDGVARAALEGIASPGSAAPTVAPTTDDSLFTTHRALSFGTNTGESLVGIDPTSVFLAGVFNQPNGTQDSLVRVDRSTLKVAAGAELSPLASIVYGGGAVWAAVGQKQDTTGCSCPTPTPSLDLLKLDPTTLKTEATFPLSAPPLFVAVAGQSLWVATADALLRIDPSDGRQLLRIPTGFQPLALAASPDGQRLYFLGSDITPSGAGTSRLTAYDAVTGRLLGTRDDKRFDQPLAPTATGVWLAASIGTVNDAIEEFTGPSLATGPSLPSISRDLNPFTFGNSVLLVDEQVDVEATVCLDPINGLIRATGSSVGISLSPTIGDKAGTYVLENHGVTSTLLDVTPTRACSG